MLAEKILSSSKELELFSSPVLYKTAGEVQDAWDRYIKKCIEESNIPTKEGVCYELKIFVHEWNDLKETKELGKAIKWMELIIADKWLQRLIGSSPQGAMFYLKNNYPELYRDRVDITSQGKAIIPQVIVYGETDLLAIALKKELGKKLEKKEELP